MFRWPILNLLLISSCFSAPMVRAEKPLCNDLLAGISNEVSSSIHDLARLRFDLDLRSAQGINDSATRALNRSFDTKWSEIQNFSGLNQDALVSIVRAEIKAIQNRDEIETRNQNQLKNEQAEAMVASDRNAEWFGNLAKARTDHTQVTLSDGNVLVIGGMNDDYALSSIELIHPTSKKVEKFGKLLKARYSHGQVMLPDGKVLVLGGQGDNGYQSSIELIDPLTRKIEEVGELEPNLFFSQSLLSDGRVMVTGGYYEHALSAISIVDPVGKKVETVGNLNEARQYHQQTTLPDGRVLVVGGFQDKIGALSSIELIDPVTLKVEKMGKLKDARYKHLQTLLPDGRVLVVGGRGREGEVSSIEIIDPYAHKIFGRRVKKLGNLKHAKTGMTLAVVSDDEVIVVGGNDSVHHSSIDVIRLKTGKIETILDLNEARASHTLSVLPDKRIMVVGGFDQDLRDLSSIEIFKVHRK